ncbi:MAG: protease SohB [Acidiferrobacteraceae bacterium]|nr:protease SohB [Acidiferrobacteraceae bacterium]|tara:strand:+ start:52 stop:1122 length:1071 start_codon:yes stop_codon:yes gene_type:complete
MQFLIEYGLFLAKTVTLLGAIIIAFGFIVSMSLRRRSSTQDQVEVRRINDKYQQMAYTLEIAMLEKNDQKKKKKSDKKQKKDAAKESKKKVSTKRKRVFVLDFHGDIRGSDVALLREEITTVLMVAKRSDEVLLRLESGGGLVHAYGLAASQLARLRESDIPLTVAVDKVAASGGYLMACVADRILAAPFAIIGSIGVITQIPNFNRLLKKHDIDFEQATAGEYKRTITMFGENTEKGREKLKAEVEEIHKLFKDFVKEKRPIVSLDEIATGEHWLAKRALELKLVDELKTSDDYLLTLREDSDIFEVKYSQKKRKFIDRITSSLSSIVENHNLLDENYSVNKKIALLRSKTDLSV